MCIKLNKKLELLWSTYLCVREYVHSPTRVWLVYSQLAASLFVVEHYLLGKKNGKAHCRQGKFRAAQEKIEREKICRVTSLS